LTAVKIRADNRPGGKGLIAKRRTGRKIMKT
jgi:hypothetical protein